MVPNLVNTVKGFAAQEQKVRFGATAARARVGTIQATQEFVNDQWAFQKCEAVQADLTQALRFLSAAREDYPQHSSGANFRDLQAQLKRTENLIALARNRYIDSLRAYNVLIRSFPSNLAAVLLK